MNKPERRRRRVTEEMKKLRKMRNDMEDHFEVWNVFVVRCFFVFYFAFAGVDSYARRKAQFSLLGLSLPVLNGRTTFSLSFLEFARRHCEACLVILLSF